MAKKSTYHVEEQYLGDCDAK